MLSNDPQVPPPDPRPFAESISALVADTPAIFKRPCSAEAENKEWSKNNFMYIMMYLEFDQ